MTARYEIGDRVRWIVTGPPIYGVIYQIDPDAGEARYHLAFPDDEHKDIVASRDEIEPA